MTWELARAPWSDITRVSRLLRNGWEPFAYAGMDIAFRRPSEATDLRPRFDDDRRVVAFIAREEP